MNRRYAQVALRAGHRCEYCHAPETLFNFPFEVDHVIPGSLHGPDDDSNWALSCRSCNLLKAAHTSAVDPESRTAAPLFHPRRDRWEDHFRAIIATGDIHGLTPSGRATVERLSLNSEAKKEARRQWMRLGLFP